MNPIATPGEQIGSTRTNLFPFDAPVCGMRRIIAVALGVNINTASNDVAVAMNTYLLANANYIITGIYVNNAQINNGGTITNSATTATLSVRVGPGGTGTTIVTDAAISGLSALTGAGANLQLTLNSPNYLFTTANNPTLYVRTGTAQGASTSATVDVYFWGEVFT